MTISDALTDLASAIATREEAKLALREFEATKRPRWWQRKARHARAARRIELAAAVVAGQAKVDDVNEALLRSSAEFQRALFAMHRGRRQVADEKIERDYSRLIAWVAGMNGETA